MNEEKNEGKVLIEETDAGRTRRENPEPEEKKKKRVSGWLIATAAVVIVGIIAGLAVYFVQQKQKNDEFERMLSVTTDKVTLKTTAEEEFEIEDSDDIVIAGDDAVGGDLAGEDATESTSWSGTTDKDDEDDEDDADDSTKKTTKRTTRRTTAWDAQKAAEDFWNGVSKWATP